MPILAIAVIVVLAVGAGAYFFTSEPEAPTSVETTVEMNRTEQEIGTEEIATQSDPVPAPEPSEDAVIEAAVETSIDTAASEEPVVEADPVSTTPPPATPVTNFVNGNYTTSVSYLTPSRSSHSMDITVTIENDVISNSSIVYDNGDGPSNSHQRRFDAAYKTEVIGMQLDEVALSRVAGASLTTESFNEAVTTIEVEARS